MNFYEAEFQKIQNDKDYHRRATLGDEQMKIVKDQLENTQNYINKPLGEQNDIFWNELNRQKNNLLDKYENSIFDKKNEFSILKLLYIDTKYFKWLWGKVREIEMNHNHHSINYACLGECKLINNFGTTWYDFLIFVNLRNDVSLEFYLIVLLSTYYFGYEKEQDFGDLYIYKYLDKMYGLLPFIDILQRTQIFKHTKSFKIFEDERIINVVRRDEEINDNKPKTSPIYK